MPAFDTLEAVCYTPSSFRAPSVVVELELSHRASCSQAEGSDDEWLWDDCIYDLNDAVAGT